MPEPAVSPDPGDLDAMLAALAAQPDDERLRERAASALLGAGRASEAVALLRAGLVHLNAHEQGGLPCLCERCLDPALERAELAGREFARDHAVARGRVLFYWLPVSLAGARAEVRRNVAARLRERLSPRRASTP